MCALGDGQFFRNEPSYSLQTIDGKNNKAECLSTQSALFANNIWLKNLWGVVGLSDVELVPNLSLTPPEWPSFPREEAVKRQTVDLQAKIEEAQKKPAREEINDLVDVAAAFSLDKTSPRQALEKIMSLENSQANILVDAIDPAALTQLIQLNAILPAFGDSSGLAILNQLEQVSFLKKATLINLLRLHRPSMVVPLLRIKMESETDSRIKMGVARTIGALFNKDQGQEPGMRSVLQALETFLASPSKSDHKKKTLQLIEKLTAIESFGVLGVAVSSITGKERTEFLKSCPLDITSTLGPKGAQTLLSILSQNRQENLKQIENELNFLDQEEPHIRIDFKDLLKSTDPAHVYGALVALGQMAHNDDAALIGAFLNHSKASIREASSVALGRLGETGVAYLSGIMESNNANIRRQAIVAMSQTVSGKGKEIIEKGMKDSDAKVRLATVSLIRSLPEALTKFKKYFLKLAKKNQPNEVDPNVKLALSLLE
jgi:HEAT repeat protein